MPVSKPPSKVEIIRTDRLLNAFIDVDNVTFRHETFAGPMSAPLERQAYLTRQACGVVIYDTEIDKLIFVRQFRLQGHLVGHGWVIELAAGMLDEGEDPAETAIREVAEETGYEVDRVEHVSTYLTAPGVMTEQIHIFYAEVQGRARVATGLDEEGEDIETIALTPAEADAMLKSGEIRDGKTMIGLMWWLHRREGASA